MNNTDLEYNRLLNLVLSQGRVKKNRTGIDTIGVFGAQARFNLQEGFPLLTTKKVFFKGIVHELLWFLSGNTNIKYLVDNDVHIWDEWAYKRYLAWFEINQKCFPQVSRQAWTQQQYIEHVKRGEVDAELSDLGSGTYGGMWRDFPIFLEHQDYYNKEHSCLNFKYEAEGCVSMYGVDQIQKVINKLKTNPDDRRMIVSAWHPYWVDYCALPPCHCLFHFNTEELTFNERMTLWQQKMGGFGLPSWFTGDIASFNTECITRFNQDKIPTRRLNCLLYQRSCDLFLGVPFNIASYALLTQMMAQVSGMVAGEFIHTYGDLHLYSNHLPQVKEQLSREPFQKLPKLFLNPDIQNLFDFKFEDIKVQDYSSHPAIKAEVAV